MPSPLLQKVVSASGRTRYYPHTVYCYTSMKSYLQKLILGPNFVEQCESTRNVTSSRGFADVYDGSLWKEFKTVDGIPFLSAPNCYGLLLNVDWFQPFDHVTYSVGVIYISILNLPRTVRFKRKNIILVGIIPGPKEPSLTLNSILAPLVSDLLEFWKGVSFRLPNDHFVVLSLVFHVISQLGERCVVS